MSSLSVDVRDNIATVTLDRPPVNAIDGTTMSEIRETFESFNDRRDICVAIFTAVGDRAFIAGVDLNTVTRRSSEPPPSRLVDSGANARSAMWAITDCAVPVIAAVNGPAIGAGLAFAACCDIIMASDNASFGTTEINVGLLGASAHLSLMVGRHKAREMFFSGELVSAEEMYRIGAVRKVVPREALIDETLEFARVLAAKSPLAMRMAKRSMNRVEFLPLKQAYETEQDGTAQLQQFEDATEARKAFFEKRDPEWKWR